MRRSETKHFRLTTTVVALVLAVVLVSAARGDGVVEVSVRYEGSGEVDESHGLVVIAFGGAAFGDPANPVLAMRYLTSNGATARFTDLGVDKVWLGAIYDEKGGFVIGPVAGPFGFYSETAGGPPAGVDVGAAPVLIRFDDSQRIPRPSSDKPEASLAALQGAAGIVEIRLYHIKPGLRDDFVEFFESTLEGQAAVGIRVPGQFRSLDDDNTFVWIRAFRDQKERQEQSHAFYFGRGWLGGKQADAGKYIESTEVILLEPTALSLLR